MWIADPTAVAPFNGVMNWALALANCEACVFAGHTDWRLPNIKELMSIQDFAFANPPIDAGIFTVYTNKYASSTSLITQPLNAWYLDTTSGVMAQQVKTANLVAMPVRLGVPAT